MRRIPMRAAPVFLLLLGAKGGVIGWWAAPVLAAVLLAAILLLLRRKKSREKVLKELGKGGRPEPEATSTPKVEEPAPDPVEEARLRQEELLEKLRARQASRREKAATALGDSPYPIPETIDGLIDALEDDDPRVITAAAKSLARFGARSGKASPGLAAKLSHFDPRTRTACALALGDIGVVAVSSLIEVMEKGGPRRKKLCLLALSRIGNDAGQAAKAVTKELASSNVPVRRMAARALAAMGPAAQPAAEDLAKALDDEDALVRRDATAALGNLGPAAAEAVPRLKDDLRSDNPHKSERAGEALAGMGDGGIDALIEVLLEGGFSAHFAAMALGKAGRPAAAALIEAGRKGGDMTKRLCVTSLAEIGSEADEAIGWLAEMLEHGDPEVRYGAAKALGAIGEKAALHVESLIALLEPDVDWGREKVVRALAGIGAKAAPLIIDSARDNPSLREVYAEALGAIGAEAMPLVVGIFKTGTDDMKDFARAAAVHAGERGVTHLVEAARSESPGVRYSAIAALSEIGSTIALPSMVRALSDPDLGVRGAAGKGLAKMGKAAVPHLVYAGKGAELEARRQIALALSAIGEDAEEAADFLASSANDADPYVRLHSIEALIKIDRGRAQKLEPSLKELSEHSHTDVRQAAAELLKTIEKG